MFYEINEGKVLSYVIMTYSDVTPIAVYKKAMKSAAILDVDRFDSVNRVDSANKMQTVDTDKIEKMQIKVLNK